jgi:hypothetical protein
VRPVDQKTELTPLPDLWLCLNAPKQPFDHFVGRFRNYFRGRANQYLDVAAAIAPDLEKTMTTILIIVVVLMLFGGGGYYGFRRRG